MTKVVSVVGTRPQFVKAAAVSRSLNYVPKIKQLLVHTGQHYDENMSQVFFSDLDIRRPDYHLRVGSGTHGFQTGKMLEALEKVLLKENPDWVVVYGDTNSTLAGALAAVKLHIPVAHVEAGLRSYNRRMPEEINRLLTDHASDLLFAPTSSAVENLSREGIPREKISLVGDVMYDAFLHYSRKAERESRILGRFQLRPMGYVLATVHRAENTDNPERLKAITEGLAQVARELTVVLPLHPRTRAALERNGLLAQVSSTLYVTDPVGYLDMVMLGKHARLIATDSGGVQKEAYFSRVPCVTLRDETEWIELLDLGWNRLVPPVSDKAVVSGLRTGLSGARGIDANPYGDGHAAKRIVQDLQARSGV